MNAESIRQTFAQMSCTPRGEPYLPYTFDFNVRALICGGPKTVVIYIWSKCLTNLIDILAVNSRNDESELYAFIRGFYNDAEDLSWNGIPTNRHFVTLETRSLSPFNYVDAWYENPFTFMFLDYIESWEPLFNNPQTKIVTHLIAANMKKFIDENVQLHSLRSEQFAQLEEKTKLLSREQAIVTRYHALVPHPSLIFRSFRDVRLSDIQACIIGQDPYPGCVRTQTKKTALSRGKAVVKLGVDYACGRSFALPPGVVEPTGSLRVILEESGCEDLTLDCWVKQGVFLYNSCPFLFPGSEAKMNPWLSFSKRVVSTILENSPNVIFMLWGANAKQYSDIIVEKNFWRALTAGHPSNRNTNGGFKGCKHFEILNNIRKEQGLRLINWK